MNRRSKKGSFDIALSRSHMLAIGRQDTRMGDGPFTFMRDQAY